MLRLATRDAAGPITHQSCVTIDQLRNSGFTDVEHKQFILPLNKWHSDSWIHDIGRWYGRTFFKSIETLSLAPFCQVLDWTPDGIQRLVTDTKAELLDPKVHTFHMLHIYAARKQAPSGMCTNVESDH
jgi:hypothetical protein